MLWIQPSWYGYGNSYCCIEKGRTYTVYDDEKGTCEQIEGAELLEEVERGSAPDGTVRLANAYCCDLGAFFLGNVCVAVEDYELPPEPDVAVVKFDLRTGEKQQNGRVDIKTDIFQYKNQGGIQIGDTYCIDWRRQEKTIEWEFCGGYLLDECDIGLELALWDIHKNQNCLSGCIRISCPEAGSWCDGFDSPGVRISGPLARGPGFYYPFELNLVTGMIDLGEWGRTQLLSAKTVKLRMLLKEPFRKEKIIKMNSILANDFPCDVVYEGLSYKSAEAAFQSAKTTDMAARKAFCNVSPEKAREMAEEVECLDFSFNDGIFRAKMVKIMEDVLYDKFTRNKVCHDELLRTGESQLIADAEAFIDGSDDYDLWGVMFLENDWRYGDNLFGRLLTRIRGDLS